MFKRQHSLIKKGRAVLIALVLFGGSEAKGERKEKVIILDLKVAGVSDEESKALKRTLGGVLAKSVANLGYEVLAPSDIQAMIGLERMKDLVGCEDDTSCLTELGGALGADLLIGGNIAKLGDKYNLTLSLVDNNAAKSKARFQGSAGTAAALTGTIQRGVAVIFGRKKEVRTRGMLLVKTEPPGAFLTMDGKPIGKSPLGIEVDAGDHEIQASLGELHGAVEVLIKPGQVTKASISLQTPPVAVRIMTSPPEATVYIDGVEYGQTPFMSEKVPSGQRLLRIELSDHAPKEIAFNFDKQKYEDSGRDPYVFNFELRERWIVEPGLSLGITGSLQDISAGVTTQIELTTDVADFLQLGLAYAVPKSGIFNLRGFLYRGVFELALIAQAAGFGRFTPEGSELPPLGFAVGGGLSLGIGVDLAVGEIGGRIESTGLYDLDKSELSLPLHVNLFWRMQ